MYTFIKKYKFLKKALKITVLINGFFIAFGAVATYDYLKTASQSALNLTLVGLGTLLFGVIVPAIIGREMLKLQNKIRKKAEESAAKWLAGWLELYKDNHHDKLKEPLFWANVLLLTGETVADGFDHPSARLIKEFSPILKGELEKALHKKKKSKTS